MIRAATPDDLDAIMTIERASFPTDAWSEAMMAGELASPHGRYLVDEQAGRIVGYGGIRAVAGAADADVQTIALDSGARGRGRGRALLVALLDEAAARRAREVFLEVRADNPVASALYVSEGFVEIGRRPRYYQPDDVDAIVMKLDLAAWTAARAAMPADPHSVSEYSPVDASGASKGEQSVSECSPVDDKNASSGECASTDSPVDDKRASSGEYSENRVGMHDGKVRAAAEGWC